MQKLWRRQLVKGPFLYNNIATGTYFTDNDKKTQAQYVDQISKAIKIFKKKEDTYFKIIQAFQSKKIEKINIQQPFPQQFISLKQEHQSNITEEMDSIANLKSFKTQPFYQSKTYLYTVFMRIVQVLELSKQKIKPQHKSISHVSKQYFEQQKAKMHQAYNNLTYFARYDIIEILQFAKKIQNDRINKFFPKKKVPYHKPPPPVFQIQRVKSLESRETRRKNSKKFFDSKIDLIISKKMIGSANNNSNNKDLTTLQGKNKKNKKINHFTNLYKILGVKNINIQDFQFSKWEIHDQMMQRNQNIRQERRKWQKQYQCSVKGFRTKIRNKIEQKN